jgi:transposase
MGRYETMERVVGVVVDEGVSRGNGQGQAGRAGSAVGTERPHSEVLAHATRRRFSAEYKLSILRQVDAYAETGEIGALLRREGLYSSNLAKWRRQREEGVLGALSPRPRGPKVNEVEAAERRIAQLEREKERLSRRLAEAELIIEFQKKVAALLGVPLRSPESDESR